MAFEYHFGDLSLGRPDSTDLFRCKRGQRITNGLAMGADDVLIHVVFVRV